MVSTPAESYSTGQSAEAVAHAAAMAMPAAAAQRHPLDGSRPSGKQITRSRWQGVLLLIAMIAWPIAHIGNIAALAVPVNVTLVVAFGSLVWPRSQYS